ncbi:hypothetical protein AgCh_024962 [Apium graveolens]
MTRDELSEAQEEEHLLTQQDIKMEQTQEKKNYLESYVYETRTKLFDTHESFATESEREGISVILQQTEIGFTRMEMMNLKLSIPRNTSRFKKGARNGE